MLKGGSGERTVHQYTVYLSQMFEEVQFGVQVTHLFKFLPAFVINEFSCLTVYEIG